MFAEKIVEMHTEAGGGKRTLSTEQRAQSSEENGSRTLMAHTERHGTGGGWNLGKTETCLQRNLRPFYYTEGRVSSFLSVQKPSTKT